MKVMIKKVSDLEPGESGKIIKILGNQNYIRRFKELGFTPGSYIELTKKAPFGDPIQVHIRNYNLAIRKDDANLIYIE